MVPPPAQAEGVPFERALEHLTVEETWTLLVRRRADIAEKQNDLQMMVGSRYHELIESADAIVAMRDTAAEVTANMAAFPAECTAVLGQAAAALAASRAFLKGGAAPKSDTAASPSSSSKDGGEDSATRLLLNAPSAIWSALDDGRHLDAAVLLLQCRATADGDGLRGPAAPFLRSQWAYVEQLTPRVLAGATRLLQRPRAAGGPDAGCCAAALATVLLVHPQAHVQAHAQAPGRGGGGDNGRGNSSSATAAGEAAAAAVVAAGLPAALQLFLRVRGRFVEAALRGEAVMADDDEGAAAAAAAAGAGAGRWLPRKAQRQAGAGKRVEASLCAAVAAMQETILDVHAIFGPPPPPLRQSSSSSSLSGGTFAAAAAAAAAAGGGENKAVGMLAVMVAEARERAAAAPNNSASAQNGALANALAAPAARKPCTEWLALLLPKVRRRSRVLLHALTDASELACVREALWTLTQPPAAAAAAGAKGVSGGAGGAGEAEEEAAWRDACTYAVDTQLLGALLSRRRRGGAAPQRQLPPPLPPPGEPLQFWPLAFSGTFAELAEGLLHSSLERAVDKIRRRLRDAAAAAAGPAAAGVMWPRLAGSGGGSGSGDGDEGSTAAAGGGGDTATASLGSGGGGGRRLAADEVLAAADGVAALLSAQLQRLSRDAWSLVQHGDSAAAAALAASLYLRSAQAIARIAVYLRETLEALTAAAARLPGAASTGASGTAAAAAAPAAAAAAGSAAATTAAAAERLVDAALLVGRVCWLLLGRRGRIIRRVLEPPAALLTRSPDRIGLDQLEAAFEIADTDGDGVVDAEEADEAIAAVSVAVAAGMPGVGAWGCQSLTLPEFALLATPLLDEQRPLSFLRECLNGAIEASLAAWADRALAGPKAALLAAEARVAAASGGGGGAAPAAAAAVSDEVWRRRYGLWDERTIELSSDAAEDTSLNGGGGGGGGRLVEERTWLPTVVSPHVLSFLECLAAEICRFSSTADHAALLARQDTDAAAPGGAAAAVAAGTDMLGRARQLVTARGAAELAALHRRLCVGAAAPARRACEAMRLQSLLDCLFLERWLPAAAAAAAGGPGGGGSAAAVLAVAADALLDDMDPINLQIYLPHLREAARGGSDACRVFLAALFPDAAAVAAPAAAAAAAAAAAVAAAGGRAAARLPDAEDGRLPLPASVAVTGPTNVMALAPRAKRFDLLPLPMPPARGSAAGAGDELTGSGSRGHGGGGTAGVASGAAGSPLSGAGRLKATAAGGGGQARQVAETMRSMLQEQAAQPLSNILGAASSFLGGGRQRR